MEYEKRNKLIATPPYRKNRNRTRKNITDQEVSQKNQQEPTPPTEENNSNKPKQKLNEEGHLPRKTTKTTRNNNENNNKNQTSNATYRGKTTTIKTKLVTPPTEENKNRLRMNVTY